MQIMEGENGRKIKTPEGLARAVIEWEKVNSSLIYTMINNKINLPSGVGNDSDRR